VPLGKVAGATAVVLATCIVIYNAAHKYIIASPWLMGLCRFWVYVIAGAASTNGLDGNSVWCGLALAIYVVGLSHVARRESFRSPIPYWPLILLAAPVFLSLVMDAGKNRIDAIWISLVLALWTARSVQTIFLPGEVNVGRIVSNLLAGIVFTDWLAVAPECPHGLSAACLLLFAAAKLLQRFVPAT
jgi:hypothetical protein